MRIGILGAGSIGCFVGGRLIAANDDVVLVGRRGAEIHELGLTLTDYLGGRVTLPPERVRYEAGVEALADCDVVLVAVKAIDTRSAGEQLAAVLRRPATVVSLQNGVSNGQILREALPGHTVLSGMVSFGVQSPAKAHFHLGTSGPIALEGPREASLELARALTQAGFEVQTHDHFDSVLWSKLLLNLNNPINALAGIPLRAELSVRDYRRVLALAMREGLACMKKAGIRATRVGKVAPGIVPHVLTLPNVLFFRVAATMIQIDEKARSSMQEDLERGRRTEIEQLNGEIIHLGERVGERVSVNRRIRDLVVRAEQKRAGSPRMPAGELLAEVLS